MSLAHLESAAIDAADPWQLQTGTILNALPLPVILVDGDNRIQSANMAAEVFLAASSDLLKRAPLDRILAPDSPLFSLIGQVRNEQSPVREYGVVLGSPRTARGPLISRSRRFSNSRAAFWFCCRNAASPRKWTVS